MKTCNRCGQSKPLDQFSKHLSRKDGYSTICRECNSSKCHEFWVHKKQDANFLLKNRERRSASRLLRPDAPRDKAAKAAANSIWLSRNTEKKRAHSAVNWALKCGRLIRKPCVICGNPKSQAHHEDYTKPLDVIWFCHTHHMKHHRNRRAEELLKRATAKGAAQ